MIRWLWAWSFGRLWDWLGEGGRFACWVVLVFVAGTSLLEWLISAIGERDQLNFMAACRETGRTEAQCRYEFLKKANSESDGGRVIIMPMSR